MTLDNFNLTNIQTTAIKGEVAMVLSQALTKADIDYFIYYMLKETNKEHRPYYIEAIKDAIDISEESLNKILFEIQADTTPLEIWINKVIADIKFSFKAPELISIGEKLPINKTQNKKNMVTSAFTLFVRKIIVRCPQASRELLKTVLEDADISFLHPMCIYLLEGCDDIQNLPCCADEISEEIFKFKFDPRDILSNAIETKSLEDELQRTEGQSSITEELRGNFETPKATITISQINLDDNSEAVSISHEKLSQFLSQKVLEFFNGMSEDSISEDITLKKHTGELRYVVQKEFKNTDIKTDIRNCKSEKEAEEFIKKIEKEYPELQRTCKFIICKKIIED